MHNRGQTREGAMFRPRGSILFDQLASVLHHFTLNKYSFTGIHLYDINTGRMDCGGNQRLLPASSIVPTPPAATSCVLTSRVSTLRITLVAKRFHGVLHRVDLLFCTTTQAEYRPGHARLHVSLRKSRGSCISLHAHACFCTL